MNKLIDILSHARCHGSDGECIIIDKYIMPLNPVIIRDSAGNHMAYIVEVGEGSTILWSCHTDTVHFMHDPVVTPVKQSVGVIKSGGNVILGADDGAGMWLLLEMIEAGVKGTYIFHRGEECGGIGSSFMAKHHKEWLSSFTHAIAFDRKCVDSIITHQFGRCCSTAFANEFGDFVYEASNCIINLRPDDTGIFTDTANYVGIIPECTNISVGYYDAHTPNEYLDLSYLFALRDAMTRVGKLEFSVYEKEEEDYGSPPSSFDAYTGADIFYEEMQSRFAGMDYDNILFYVSQHPEDLADLIEKWVA